MAIRHAGDRIAPAWRSALSLLGGMRRWVFLPALVGAVPQLVLLKGGDALSVCFNTVAMLFLCELDNLTYAVFLPERLHTRVEDEGRVELGGAQASSLMVSKWGHVATLLVAVPSILVSGHFLVVMMLPFGAFWVAGAAEIALGAASVSVSCREIGKMTGRCLLGHVGYWVLCFASSNPEALLPAALLLALVALVGVCCER